MVDPVNSSGQAQSILSAIKPQKTSETKEEKQAVSQNSDEVVISEEALNLRQAEETAKKVNSYIASQPNATLSSDTRRLSTLV